MSYPSLLLSAVAFMALTAYAQHQVPRYTRAANVWPLRLVLLAIGAALGLTIATTQALRPGGIGAVLTFIIGFGLVHTPAAIILALKRLRGSGRT